MLLDPFLGNCLRREELTPIFFSSVTRKEVELLFFWVLLEIPNITDVSVFCSAPGSILLKSTPLYQRYQQESTVIL
jgi:hypothetical protein